MNISFTFLMAATVFFTVAAVACLFVFLFKIIFFHKSVSGRLTASAVLFSVAIISFSVILIFIQQPLEKLSEIRLAENIFYYSTIAVVAFLITCFYRVLAPLAILAYILYCSLCSFCLFSVYGSRNTALELYMDEETVTISGKTIENRQNSADSPQNNFLVVKTLVCSEKLLLPLPSLWYSPIAVASSREFSEAGIVSEEQTVGKKTSVVHFFTKLIDDTSSTALYYIEIPQNSVFPAVYSLEFAAQNSVFTYKLTKIF